MAAVAPLVIKESLKCCCITNNMSEGSLHLLVVRCVVIITVIIRVLGWGGYGITVVRFAFERKYDGGGFLAGNQNRTYEITELRKCKQAKVQALSRWEKEGSSAEVGKKCGRLSTSMMSRTWSRD